MAKQINWVTGEKVMRALHIDTRGTLCHMRKKGKIDFLKVSERNILYPDWVLNGVLLNPEFKKIIAESHSNQN